jgi:hydrogenase expression/formation protein HypC
MCLSVPGQVVDLDAGRQVATVAVLDARREVSVLLVPEVAVGDWVLVHVGFAIARIDEDEAARSLALLGEALDAEAAADAEGGPR